MKLKSIEIHGFKSFPDRTRLEFNSPITAVVGPNGSGKSNISDAVRWVLGEQSSKSLRGAKMEDVIFGGTQSRKSQGFASVTLTIDNSAQIVDIDCDEVSVTRKLYRSGESEYRINQNAVRLKDVHSLFMDTGLGRDGYSIIGQGKIAEIVSAKSKERREIFEEAAGIAKYRYQKSEAERRLSSAEDNLSRLKDILLELEQRIEPLKKESAKAKQFVELSNEKKTVEISLWINTINNSKDRIKEQEDKIQACKLEYDEIVEHIENVEKEINEIYISMQNCTIAMDNYRTEIKNIEEQKANGSSDIAVSENTILHNNSVINDLENDLKRINEGEDEIDEIISSSKINLDETEKLLVAETAALVAIKEQIEAEQKLLQQNNSQTDILKVKRAQCYTKINEAKLTGASSETMLEESTQRLSEINSLKELRAENLTKLESEVANCNGLILEIDERLTELTNSKGGYTLKLNSRVKLLEDITEKCREIIDKISAKEQRAKLLADMENAMEGFAHSVKFIHKASDNKELRGIVGTVSSVITAEEKYSLAIETALGGAMQHIIVSDENSAKEAISALRRAKAGRATFLPLTSVKGKTITENGLNKHPGFMGIASELVSYKAEHKQIIENLLGRILVAENLENATSIAKAYGYRYRVVTMDGQVINAGGSYTGGSQIQSAGVLSRRSEIAKLRETANSLKVDLEKRNEEKEKLQTEVSAINASLTAIDSEMLTANEDKFAAQAELKIASSAYNEATEAERRTQEQLAELKDRLSELTKQSSGANELIKTLEEELANCEMSLQLIAGDSEELRIQIDNSQQKRSEKEMLILSKEKDKESIIIRLEQYSSQKEGQTQRSNDLKERVLQLTAKNSELLEVVKALKESQISFETEIADLNEKISLTRKERESFEEKTTTLRNSTKSFSDKKEQFSASLARLEEKKNSLQLEYDSIITKLWEEYELTRSQAEEFAVQIENVSESNSRLAALRSKIRALGNVNVGAIEEYDEVSTRYVFLKEQLEDVEGARDKLLKLIADLTYQMQAIFVEQFKAINENFSRIFVELFGGGRASLTLSEPENVLESGIDIFVQPPGKLIKSLQSLSGGEQAFVAIAIYFSILKVNPSPFCLLDEIEAALDDVNVSRYARYLRRMSDNTQFITITHRRGTMEEADVLYGVTMQEEGVSKLLELKVSEIEAKLGMK